MSSIHRECGEEIRWAYRNDDPSRFNPPLEYIGMVYIIDEQGTAIQTIGYKVHQCDPDKMRAWYKRLREIAEIQGTPLEDIDRYAVARDAERENRYDEAMKRKCTRCGASKGKPCTSLAKGPKFGNATKWPHPEREELYDR